MLRKGTALLLLAAAACMPGERSDEHSSEQSRNLAERPQATARAVLEQAVAAIGVGKRCGRSTSSVCGSKARTGRACRCLLRRRRSKLARSETLLLDSRTID
jgi:hypothetical protein